MRILTATVDTDTEVGADSSEEADNALPAQSLSNTSLIRMLTLAWGKRSTILAETPCLNML